jgi:hypothetical protein
MPEDRSDYNYPWKDRFVDEYLEQAAGIWNIGAPTIDRDNGRIFVVVYHLGWQRRLLRFNGEKVGRGFVRGHDPRTIWVHVCREITHIGHDPAPSAGGGLRVGS